MIKGVACIPRVSCIDVNVKYSGDVVADLSDLIVDLKAADIRICSFETTPARWRFVLPQHDVKRAVAIIKDYENNITYAYYAAMLSFIGCRDVQVLHELLGAHDGLESDTVHVSASSTHILTQRVDISAMLDELVAKMTNLES